MFDLEQQLGIRESDRLHNSETVKQKEKSMGNNISSQMETDISADEIVNILNKHSFKEQNIILSTVKDIIKKQRNDLISELKNKISEYNRSIDTLSTDIFNLLNF